MITQQIKKWVELLLPAQCLVCALKSNNKLICHHCEKKILTKRAYCLHCALPLNKNADYCGDCLKKNYLFSHIHALGDYINPLSILVKQLKYQQQLVAGELLAELLIKSVLCRYTKQQLSAFDYLLAVPLHPKKLQQRGFNQAKIIAEVLAKQLHIPLLLDAVSRNKVTMPQEGLSIRQRKQNLQGAFSVNKAIQWQGKHIVLLDDVDTTGATINSLSQCLLAEKVASITVLCICRTPLHH